MAQLLVKARSALIDSPQQPQLLGPADIRRLAEQLSVRPTKTLGQNFVHDANTVRRIVAAAHVGPDDVALEVGPGLGSLTLALLGVAGSVCAVEIDPVLAARLPQTVAERAPGRNFSLVEADAMKVGRGDLPVEPTALVANLPYNVAVPVLLHMLTELPSLRTALVMVQLEVAQRLAAEPGSRTYGVPSVKARFFGEVSQAGRVGASVFWPEPKVESGLVRIVRYAQSPWPTDDEFRRTVFTIIDAAFAQRRKTLRSALRSLAGSAEAAQAWLAEAGIDPMLRGERLDIDGYVALAHGATELPFAHSR